VNVSRRVLVVDDDEDNRLVISDRLAAEGFEVHEARDAEEGLKLAEALRPNLILMDLWLPGIDGYEATRRIKAHPALSRIPVIAVTSYALKGDDDKAAEAGCDGYLAKPYDPVALIETIRTYLG
jgi:two-component system cell cycle response regulator DivK